MSILIAALIVALGVVDAWVTGLVLKAGGREANPLMAWLQKVAPKYWEAMKLAVHVAVAGAVMSVPEFIYGGYLFVAVYVFIVVWNLRVLRKLEQ